MQSLERLQRVARRNTVSLGQTPQKEGQSRAKKRDLERWETSGSCNCMCDSTWQIVTCGTSISFKSKECGGGAKA